MLEILEHLKGCSWMRTGAYLLTFVMALEIVVSGIVAIGKTIVLTIRALKK